MKRTLWSWDQQIFQNLKMNTRCLLMFCLSRVSHEEKEKHQTKCSVTDAQWEQCRLKVHVETAPVDCLFSECKGTI